MSDVSRRKFLQLVSLATASLALPSTAIALETNFIPPVYVAKTFDYGQIYMSPEAMEDILNWGVDKLDETTRKAILRN